MTEPKQARRTIANQAGKSSSVSGASSTDSCEGIKETQVFSAQFENLDKAREFVAEAALTCGLSESAVYAAQLAVDEAFTNIIEHAYGGECLEKIECTCLVTERDLVITLRDCGNPFDPSVVPEPDLCAELEERDIGGLGLFFIQQLMDEVEFSFTQDADTGKQCNVIRMVKHKER